MKEVYQDDKVIIEVNEDKQQYRLSFFNDDLHYLGEIMFDSEGHQLVNDFEHMYSDEHTPNIVSSTIKDYIADIYSIWPSLINVDFKHNEIRMSYDESHFKQAKFLAQIEIRTNKYTADDVTIDCGDKFEFQHTWPVEIDDENKMIIYHFVTYDKC